MRCVSFWKKLISFVLTFLFGICVSSWFVQSESQKQETKQKVALVEPKELKNDSAKPKCKRYRYENKNLAKLIQKEEAAKALIKNASRKERVSYRLELREIERKIDLLKKIKNEQRFLLQEPMVLHNLLYIENCAEY